MKKILPLLSLLFCLSACDFDSSGTDHTQGISQTPIEGAPTEGTPSAAAVPDAKSDQICIPGQKVGLITATSTEADIIKAYGQENVVRKEIGLNEGETAQGTIVFPDSDKQLIIEWKEDQVYQKIARIRIEGEKAPWKLKQGGIGIGTSLAELEKVNGKAFHFYGFEWDYAGLCNDWQEGNLANTQLKLFLTPSNPEAIYPDLLGDEKFPSTHSKAKIAGLQVSAFTIEF